MVEIVLSQFCIFTVLRVISFTIPLADPLGKAIQSPIRSISLAESCTPATNPKILSLNTNINTAAEAPNPAKRVAGDLSIRIDMAMIAATKNSSTCNTWTNPFIG